MEGTPRENPLLWRGPRSGGWVTSLAAIARTFKFLIFALIFFLMSLSPLGLGFMQKGLPGTSREAFKFWCLEDAYREVPGAAAIAATATFMEARMNAQK
jgi:hypothetical protein